jgi:hypothetical protein
VPLFEVLYSSNAHAGELGKRRLIELSLNSQTSKLAANVGLPLGRRQLWIEDSALGRADIVLCKRHIYILTEVLAL